jgi:hypothetical protein
MIIAETLKYIDINEVIGVFCELTGWESTKDGIYNVKFTKPVFDVTYPTNANGHVLSGESKYAYLLKNPEEYLSFGHYKNMSIYVDSLKLFTTERIHQGEFKYVEISLTTIILWLMLNEELKIEDALYHEEW